REFIEKVYDLMSAARAEDQKWSISGLDDYAAVDAKDLVEVLQGVDKAGGIPSDTFNIEVKTRLAEAFLPDLDEQKKEKMRAEIEDGVKNPPEPEDGIAALHDAAIAAADGKPGRRRVRGRGKKDSKEPVGGGSDSSGAAASAA